MMEQVVDALPEDVRAVVLMRAIEDVSVKEAASCLGIRPETGKTRVHRARFVSAQTEPFPLDETRRERIAGRVMRWLGPHRSSCGRKNPGTFQSSAHPMRRSAGIRCQTAGSSAIIAGVGPRPT